MPELSTITIQGFRSISAIEKLELRDVNVLVGPNGSGKSNFIGVFSFLNAIRQGRLQDYVIKAGGANKILHFGSKVTRQIRLHLSFQEGVNQYEIEFVPSEADELVPSSETVYFWDRKSYEKPYDQGLFRLGKEAGISAKDLTRIPKYVATHLERWRLYHFHDTSSSSPMKQTTDVNDNRFLRPDGSNLAAFLYYLGHKHQESYSLIVRTIQRVAPFFDDFILEPQRLNKDKIRLEWRHKRLDTYFDATSLSDGSLRFIALATLFLQPEEYKPSVILVDEPELGLHPFAITMLASLVRQASSTTQVILSTQSSLLLDHFEPEDVLVADLVKDSTQLRRLDRDSLTSWLQDYSLGQLWEKNEIGGRPSSY